MFASSGEMTAPCGVPSSVSIKTALLQHARLQPFLYQADDPSIADAVFDETVQPFVG